MRWLVRAREKTLNGMAVIFVTVLLAAGCSANPPAADDYGQAVGASQGTDVAAAPEISAEILCVHASLCGQARSAGAPTRWVSLRTFTFDYDDATIGTADLNKAADISEYIGRNHTLRIVIDGSVNPRGIDPHNAGLRDRRVEVVRAALIAAGVSPYLIETGAFGNERGMGDRTVDVLVRTGE